MRTMQAIVTWRSRGLLHPEHCSVNPDLCTRLLGVAARSLVDFPGRTTHPQVGLPVQQWVHLVQCCTRVIRTELCQNCQMALTIVS